MLFRRIVVTDQGVYRPKALVPRLVIYVVGLLVIAVAALTGRVPLASAAMYFALLGVPFAWAFYTYLKHGKLGRPCVALSASTLVMDRPQRGEHVSFALADLKHILVYGFQGRRAYRFERRDGGVEEVVPLWGRPVEAAVIQFLRDRLPRAVQLTVDEPQSVFGARKGGGQ